MLMLQQRGMIENCNNIQIEKVIFNIIYVYTQYQHIIEHIMAFVSSVTYNM